MRLLPRTRTALAALALFLAPARPASSGIVPELIHDEVDFPGTIRFAPDRRLFYLETFNGRVMTYSNAVASTPTVWATIPVVSTGEHGLLGLAFHPQFPDSPLVYLHHTNPDPFFNRVVRMRDSAGVGTQYMVLVDSLSALSDTHNGGRLAFGPDQFLYVTVGDQYVPSNAQDLSTPLGKILRLTTTGRPAPENPFGPDNPAVVYGIRNSYGLCFDPETGHGYFTENGPTCDDELNFFQFAANYGWGPDDSCGTQPAGTKLPMLTYTPTIVPTGICVYRGSLLPFNGDVFFCSFYGGLVRRVILEPGHPDSVNTLQELFTFPTAALDITQGPDECLWVSTANSIWRIGTPSPVAVNDRAPTAATWMPGPSPFTNRVALAPRGGEGLRRVDVLDVNGRRVRSFTGPISASLIWNGEDQAGRPLPAGVYFLRGVTDAGAVTRRVVRLAR